MDARLTKQVVFSRFMWFACVIGLGMGWLNMMSHMHVDEEAAARELGPAINKSCPLTAQPVDESVEPSSWRGMSIGFCTKQCAEDWGRLSDMEREMMLSDARISFVGSGAAR